MILSSYVVLAGLPDISGLLHKAPCHVGCALARHQASCHVGCALPRVMSPPAPNRASLETVLAQRPCMKPPPHYAVTHAAQTQRDLRGGVPRTQVCREVTNRNVRIKIAPVLITARQRLLGATSLEAGVSPSLGLASSSSAPVLHRRRQDAADGLPQARRLGTRRRSLLHDGRRPPPPFPLSPREPAPPRTPALAPRRRQQHHSGGTSPARAAPSSTNAASLRKSSS